MDSAAFYKLDDCILPEFKIKPDSNGLFCIEEIGRGNDCICNQIWLNPSGKPCLAYKFDKQPVRSPKSKQKQKEWTLFPFLQTIPGLQAICDALVFCLENENKIRIYVINLKSGQHSNCLNQFASGVHLAIFLIETYYRHFLLKNIDYDIVRLYFTANNKLTSRKSRDAKKMGNIYDYTKNIFCLSHTSAQEAYVLNNSIKDDYIIECFKRLPYHKMYQDFPVL